VLVGVTVGVDVGVAVGVLVGVSVGMIGHEHCSGFVPHGFAGLGSAQLPQADSIPVKAPCPMLGQTTPLQRLKQLGCDVVHPAQIRVPSPHSHWQHPSAPACRVNPGAANTRISPKMTVPNARAMSVRCHIP
jgi:hypothetical protein